MFLKNKQWHKWLQMAAYCNSHIYNSVTCNNTLYMYESFYKTTEMLSLEMILIDASTSRSDTHEVWSSDAWSIALLLI